MITMLQKTVTIKLETQQEINLLTSLLGGLTEEVLEKFKLPPMWVTNPWSELDSQADGDRPLLNISIDN